MVWGVCLLVRSRFGVPRLGKREKIALFLNILLFFKAQQRVSSRPLMLMMLNLPRLSQTSPLLRRGIGRGLEVPVE